jgi:hypothetical protein
LVQNLRKALPQCLRTPFGNEQAWCKSISKMKKFEIQLHQSESFQNAIGPALGGAPD